MRQSKHTTLKLLSLLALAILAIVLITIVTAFAIPGFIASLVFHGFQVGWRGYRHIYTLMIEGIEDGNNR